MKTIVQMRIVIHNFGPIKEADIETKRYTVFIGQTSTGKSVAAKLISIANDLDFMMLENGDFKGFVGFLAKYSIDFPFNKDTEIKFFHNKATWTIRKDSLDQDGEFESIWNTLHSKNIKKKDAYLEMFEDVLSNDNVDAVSNKMLSDFMQSRLQGKEVNLENFSDFDSRMMYLALRQANNPVYIPAERILISIFTNSIYSLLASETTIPDSIKRFGSLYQKAKSKEKMLDIDFMNIIVRFSKEQDTIHIANDDVDIDFSKASSGMQSIIPMWSVFCYSVNEYRRNIVIEEPELNLFPTLQVALIKKMIEKIGLSSTNLVITTHSPYILSVFDNLIYAYDVYSKALRKMDVEKLERIVKFFSPNGLVCFDDVAAYSFDDNGIVTYINDAETRSTGAYALDTASNETTNVFNVLLAIDNEL